MKFKKITMVLSCAALLTSAFAQDIDDFDSGSDYEESPITVTGSASLGARVYVDPRQAGDDEKEVGGGKNIKDWKTDARPDAKLNIEYTGTNSDMKATLKFDKNSLGAYKEDILDEFVMNARINDNFSISAGKMRTVWGKCDKLHVLDNFNANDYTDYIIPDYIDRRIAEPMVSITAATAACNLKFEAIFTPWMTPDRLGDGVWEPKAIGSLTDAVTESIYGGLAAVTTAKVEANAKLIALNTLKARYDTAKGVVAAGTPSQAQLDEVTAATSSLIAALTNDGITVNSLTLDATLEGVIKGLEDAVADAETAYLLTLTNASSFSANDLYPNTRKIKYAQAGARLTATFGPVDLGFSYYYGHYKQPSANLSQLVTASGMSLVRTGVTAAVKQQIIAEAKAADPSLSDTDAETFAESQLASGNYDDKIEATTIKQMGAFYNPTDDVPLPTLDYDMLQVFGFEGAYIIPWIGLNTRWEVAYNLTKDIKGDDPFVHNNSISWVAGFDRDIPIHNLNLNVQTQGKFIFNTDKIEDMGAFKSYDVDYVRNKDGDILKTNNKIVVDITDTWRYERIKLDIKAIYGIEQGDLLVMPSLSFKLKDSFVLDLSGLYIWCKDEYSEFDGWEKNSFAQVSFRYSF